jgi:hypothetical protein
LPAVASELARCGRRVDDDLISSQTPLLVREFYDPATEYGGHSFLTLGTNERNEINEDDLLAVILLGVTFNALNVRRLLDRESRARQQLIHALTAVPSDLDLTSEIELASGFRQAVHEVVGGSQGVAVQKLCARKRPRLMPIVDSVVWKRLALRSGGSWYTIKELLDPRRRETLTAIARQAENDGVVRLDDVPELRLFDTVIWMHHRGGRNSPVIGWGCRRGPHGPPIHRQPRQFSRRTPKPGLHVPVRATARLNPHSWRCLLVHPHPTDRRA